MHDQKITSEPAFNDPFDVPPNWRVREMKHKGPPKVTYGIGQRLVLLLEADVDDLRAEVTTHTAALAANLCGVPIDHALDLAIAPLRVPPG